MAKHGHGGGSHGSSSSSHSGSSSGSSHGNSAGGAPGSSAGGHHGSSPGGHGGSSSGSHSGGSGGRPGGPHGNAGGHNGYQVQPSGLNTMSSKLNNLASSLQETAGRIGNHHPGGGAFGKVGEALGGRLGDMIGTIQKHVGDVGKGASGASAKLSKTVNALKENETRIAKQFDNIVDSGTPPRPHTPGGGAPGTRAGGSGGSPRPSKRPRLDSGASQGPGRPPTPPPLPATSTPGKPPKVSGGHDQLNQSGLKPNNNPMSGSLNQPHTGDPNKWDNPNNPMLSTPPPRPGSNRPFNTHYFRPGDLQANPMVSAGQNQHGLSFPSKPTDQATVNSWSGKPNFTSNNQYATDYQGSGSKPNFVQSPWSGQNPFYVHAHANPNVFAGQVDSTPPLNAHGSPYPGAGGKPYLKQDGTPFGDTDPWHGNAAPGDLNQKITMNGATHGQALQANHWFQQATQNDPNRPLVYMSCQSGHPNGSAAAGSANYLHGGSTYNPVYAPTGVGVRMTGQNASYYGVQPVQNVSTPTPGQFQGYFRPPPASGGTP